MRNAVRVLAALSALCLLLTGCGTARWFPGETVVVLSPSEPGSTQETEETAETAGTVEVTETAEETGTSKAETVEETETVETDGTCPSPASVTAPSGAGNPEGADSAAQAYVLNTRSKKFHYPGCSGVSRMKTENRAEFHGTREELLQEGYTPCGICKP